LTLIQHFLVTEIRHPTPDQKVGAGERGTMCDTWAGNLSAGLQESRGEISCRDYIQIVACRAMYVTSKEEQFAGGSGSRGQRMTISGKW
jgi:hypothetical protein